MQATLAYNTKGVYDFLLRFAADFPEEDALLVPPGDELALEYFADVLFSYTIPDHISLGRKRQAVKRLQDLHKTSNIPEVTVAYTMGSVNLSHAEAELAQKQAAVAASKVLRDETGNPYIAGLYDNAVLLLSDPTGVS